MPTHLQNLRNTFLVRLKKELAEYSFTKSGDTFYRNTSYGKDFIEVYFVTRPGVAFRADLTVNVRHEAVERIVSEYMLDMPRELDPRVATIRNRLDNLQGQSMAWYMSSDSDVEAVTADIMRIVGCVVLPYMERFSCLEEVLRMMSSDDEEDRRYYSYLGVRRGMRLVAMAYVLRDKERFESLVAQQIPFLQKLYEEDPEFKGREFPMFLQEVEMLRKCWPQD